jgi:purine-cytosine permease-like protein
MSEVTDVAGNPVFGLETHGFDHIPERDRKMTIREANFFWVGTNANLFFVTVGALAVSLGLTLWQALVACLAGNLLFAYVAYASIGGARTGLPAVLFTRAVFGTRGNQPNVVLAWVSSVAFETINTIFGVYALLALFPLMGWHHPSATGKIVAIVLQLLLAGGIAVLGHATMVYLQRIFAFLLVGVLVLVFVYTIGGVHWSQPGHVHGGAALALFFVACAVIASGPISYLYNCSDWVRYLPSRTSAHRIFWNVFASSGITALFLCVMGALLASRGDMTDPVAGVKPFVPLWLFVIYIFAAVGGSVANNMATYYSSGLALQSLGLPLHRYAATAVDTVVSTGLVLYIVFVQDFTTALNNFVAMLIVWLAPFAGVWLADGTLRRWVYDPVAVHSTRPGDGYWAWHGIRRQGWIAMLVGVGACLLTVNAPIYKGPVASALDGADLSWIVGPLVSAVVYVLISSRRVRQVTAPFASSVSPVIEPGESAS